MKARKHGNDSDEKYNSDEPLHFKPEMVDKWKKLDESERNEALHASFIWLMSDFLFSSNNLPNTWLEYLQAEHMLGIKKGTINLEFPVLQDKVLTNPQLTVIKMLFKAHEVLRNAINNRKEILSLIEFVKKIEFPLISVDRAIYYAKDQVQIEKMCSALLDFAKTFPPDAKFEPGFQFNLHQFVKSYDRRLVASVLVGRSIGIIVCKVCQSGNLKLVREIMSVCSELEQSVYIRKAGNEHFQQREYEKAIDSYTKSLEMTKYNAIAYCNRCQAALNLKKYKLAICDGYRVIALNPSWGKAYYRLAEAYKEDGCLQEAIFFNQRGLEMSEDDNETEELKKQHAKFAEILKSRAKDNSDPGTSKKKKLKKAKKKNNKENETTSLPEAPDDLPSLLSDSDSMKDVSDGEVDVSGHFKVSQREIDRRVKLKEEEERKKELEEREKERFLKELSTPNMQEWVKSMFADEVLRKFLENNPLFPSAERIEQSFACNQQTTSDSKNGKGKHANKQKKTSVIKEISNSKETQTYKNFEALKLDNNSKSSAKILMEEGLDPVFKAYKEQKLKKPPIVKETPKPKEADPFKIYNNARTCGSKALKNKDFDSAISQYDIAIKTLDKLKASKVSNADRFILFYSRGFVSLEIQTPPEIARSLDYFAMLVKPSKECGNYSHPVLYYAIAYAHYLLNNFFMITKPLTIGMTMIEQKQIKPLIWPGLDIVVPESEPGYLKKLMQDLLRSPQHPPKPDAICSYGKCEKEGKSEARFHSICDKEVDRKEIYHSDLNFEGYIKLYCSWECLSCFHLKCWSKFKHDNFKKSGDKDIIDIPCLTDGCKGTLSRIVMIDESGSVKKNVVSEKTQSKDKDENKKPAAPKMQKNERNFKKRVKQMEEAKHKKQQMKQKAENENDVPVKPKPQLEKIYTDDDIANAKVLKRETKETVHSKAKPNKQRIKKKANAITLNAFLEQSRDRQLNTSEIEQEILASRSADAPFQIPDELIDEVQQFENTLTDVEVFWTSCLYEYFENFFEQNGPVKVQDDLLLQQQLLFPDTMRDIIEKHGDIISFLLKNQYRFLIVAPYIGLPSQEQQLKVLAEEFQLSLKPKKLNHPQLPSTLDTLDCDFDGPSTLSDFARDLYDVGEVSLSEVQNITGLGLSGGMELDSFDDPIDLPATLNKNGEYQPVDSLVKSMDEYLSNNDPETRSVNDDKFAFSVPLTPMSSDKVSNAEEEEVENEEVPYSSNSVATQTTLAASYFDEMKNLREKNFELQSEVEDFKSKFARLTMITKTEITAKNQELEKTKDSLAIAHQKVSDLTEQTDSELKRIAVERVSWEDKLKLTNERLIEAKETQTVQLEQIKKLEQKLKSKEEDCDKLSVILQNQRATWREEKASNNSERDKLTSELQQANRRVIEAETKVLENDQNHAIKTLLKARSECEKIVSELEKLIRNYSSNPQAQAEVMKGYRKWKVNIDTCTQYLEQTKQRGRAQLRTLSKFIDGFYSLALDTQPGILTFLPYLEQQFETNCELLSGGVKLSDLGQFQTFTPPPPGPSLQQVAAAAMRVASMGSTGAGNNPFQIPHPSTSLLKNGTDRISPLGSMPRFSQPPIGTGKQNFPVPSTSPHSPAASNSESAATSAPQPKAGSFEKIMIQLQTLFPTVSRPNLALCIKEVRQNNNNSLAGLSLDSIVQQASMVVHSKKLSPKLSNISSSSWSFNNRESKSELSSFAEEDPCVICHDPLTTNENHKLLCGHVFHRNCLAQWLERNRTCPTCREFAIDTKEFPLLGSTAKRT